MSFTMWGLRLPQLPTVRHAGGIWYPSSPASLGRTQPDSPLQKALRRPSAPTSGSRIVKRVFSSVAQDLTVVSTNPVFRLFGCALILTSHEPLAELLLRGVVVFVCARAAMRVYPMVRRGIDKTCRKVRAWIEGTCAAARGREDEVDDIDAA